MELRNLEPDKIQTRWGKSRILIYNLQGWKIPFRLQFHDKMTNKLTQDVSYKEAHTSEWLALDVYKTLSVAKRY